MRDIKFKAKRKYNNKWVYGYVFKDLNGTCQMLYNNDNGDIEFIDIIPETICEYTGLKDKNGVEIYENDIVEVVSDNWDIIEPKERKYVVEYRQDSFGIGYDLADLFDFEVIGNIYDKEVKEHDL